MYRVIHIDGFKSYIRKSITAMKRFSMVEVRTKKFLCIYFYFLVKVTILFQFYGSCFSVSLGIYGFVTLKFTNYDYGCGLQRALLVAKMPYDYNIVTVVKHLWVNSAKELQM